MVGITSDAPTGMLSSYRPQTKFAKVMFLHMSASHSVHGEGDLPRYSGEVHPRGRYTPQTGTPCRMMKTKGMVFRYTWVYSKEDTMAHTGRPVVTS